MMPDEREDAAMEEVLGDAEPLAAAEAPQEGAVAVQVARVQVAPEMPQCGLWFRWQLDLDAIRAAAQAARAADAAQAPEDGKGAEEETGQQQQEEEEVPRGEGSFEVCECESGAREEVLLVRGIPLVEAALCAVLGTELVVQAFVGDSGNAETDRMVGEARLDLGAVVSSKAGEVALPVELIAPPPEPAEDDAEGKGAEGEGEQELTALAVEVRLTADNALRAFCQAGRTLVLAAPELRNLPGPWEAVAKACSGELSLEVAQRVAAVGPSETFEEAKVTAAEHDAEAQQAAGDAQGEGNEDDDAEAKAEAGEISTEPEPTKTCVRWGADSTLRRLFFAKESIEGLLSSGEPPTLHLRCRFPRPPVDPKAKGEVPEFLDTAEGVLSLPGLEAPGAGGIAAEACLSIVRPKPDVDPEAAEAGGKEATTPEATDTDESPTTMDTVALSVTVQFVPPLVQEPEPPKAVLATPRELVPAHPAPRIRTRSAEELVEEEVDLVAEAVASELARVMEQEEEEEAEQARGALSPKSGQTARSPTSPKSNLAQSPTSPTMPSTVGGPDEREARVFFELNANGKYAIIREQLRRTITKFVSEQRGELRAEGDVLYSTIYERIMVLLHRALNKKLEAAKRGLDRLEAARPAEQVASDLESRLAELLARAKDAQARGKMELAEKLYQTRLAESERAVKQPSDLDLAVDPEVWFEYGVFCMQRGPQFHAIAAEGFRNAIALDDKHTGSLAAYGALLAELGMAAEDQVEAFLAPVSTLVGDALKTEANRVYVATAQGVLQTLRARLADEQPSATATLARLAAFEGDPALETLSEGDDDARGDCEVLAQIVLLSRAAMQCLEWGLASVGRALIDRRGELLSSVRVSSNAIARRARYYGKLLQGWAAFVEGNGNAGEEAVRQALDEDAAAPEAFALLGLLGELERSEARRLLEECSARLHSEAEGSVGSVWSARLAAASDDKYCGMLIVLGDLQLADGAFAEARETFVRLCARRPTPGAWAGLGVALLRLERLREATDALSEANRLDRTDPETWGYLALACQLQAAGERPKRSELSRLSELAFEQAVRLGLSSAPPLLFELGVAFTEAGRFGLAGAALERACASDQAQPAYRVALARLYVLSGNFERAQGLMAELQESEADSDAHRDLERLLAKCRPAPAAPPGAPPLQAD